MLRISLLFIALAISLPVTAQEVELPEAESPEESPSAYQLGVQALEAGRTEEAVTHFQAAFDADRSTQNALALAATLQESGALQQAIELYRVLLSDELGALDADTAQRVVAARALARSQLATARLRTTDARILRVFVDGELVGSLSANAALELQLDPGAHQFVAEFEGARGEEITQNLAAGAAADIELRGAVSAPSPEELAREVEQEEQPEVVPTETEAERRVRVRRRRRVLIAVAAIVVVGAAVGLGVGVGSDDRFSRGPFGTVSALSQND